MAGLRDADGREHPYAALTPDAVIAALESFGLHADGRLLALNSYENRVYRVHLEDDAPLVAKFYRPGRWSTPQILEEHAFISELAAAEIPAVAPLVLAGSTLNEHGGFRFAVFPTRGGRGPNLEDEETLRWLGRFLGRIHAIGGTTPFRERPALDRRTFGTEPREWIRERGVISPDLEAVWLGVVDQALDTIAACEARAGATNRIRLHGDVHVGNLLWVEARGNGRGNLRGDPSVADGPLFLDFDDARSGPAVQDLWMLLSGDRPAMERQLGLLLSGYREFQDFDLRELHLVEALRTLRLIHYSYWIARRWDDPAFPAAFPWFGDTRYWQDRILEIREQIPLMNEPCLEPDPA